MSRYAKADSNDWKNLTAFYKRQPAYHRELKRLKSIENALKIRSSHFQEIARRPFVNVPRNNWATKYDAYLAGIKAGKAQQWGSKYDTHIARQKRLAAAARQSRIARAKYQQAQWVIRNTQKGGKRKRFDNYSMVPLKRRR